MESFEHNGFWWLPESPENKYPGILSFDPINGGHLELILGKTHEFFARDGSGKIDIIHGLIQGSRVTLRGCYFRNGSFSVPGFDEIKILVENIYKGRHFDKVEDIVFEELSVSYTHLNNWMYHYSSDIFRMSKDAHDFNVSYNSFAPLSISINDNLDIRLHYHNTKNSSITGVSLQNEARITITSKEKLLFNEYYRLFNLHLPNFLTLATGLTNYPSSIKGTVSDNPRSVSIYYKTLGYVEPRSISDMEMLFSFKDVENNLSTYLSNWINKSEELWAVYDEYFQFYHQRYIELKSQFLSFTRALEAYHRNRHKGEYLSCKEYKPLKEELIKTISNLETTKAHKDRLKGAVKYGYEFSLRKRLRMICNEILGGYEEIIEKLLGDSNSFVDKVTDTRNYLTHNLKEPPENAIPDEKLYYYILKMQFLLRICFLVEMGFPPDEIKRLMNRNMEYEYKSLIE